MESKAFQKRINQEQFDVERYAVVFERGDRRTAIVSIVKDEANKHIVLMAGPDITYGACGCGHSIGMHENLDADCIYPACPCAGFEEEE